MIALDASERPTLPPPQVSGATSFAAAIAALRRCPGHEADHAEGHLRDALRLNGIEAAVMQHVCPECEGRGTQRNAAGRDVPPLFVCRRCDGRGWIVR